jgi:hypothetical protein
MGNQALQADHPLYSSESAKWRSDDKKRGLPYTARDGKTSTLIQTEEFAEYLLAHLHSDHLIECLLLESDSAVAAAIRTSSPPTAAEATALATPQSAALAQCEKELSQVTARQDFIL